MKSFSKLLLIEPPECDFTERIKCKGIRKVRKNRNLQILQTPVCLKTPESGRGNS